MKKIVLFICLLCMGQLSLAQKIFFDKANYADSALFEKNIPQLAKATIVAYQPKDPIDYADNLFRLQVVAGDYVAVPQTLNKMVMLLYGDSTTYPGIGFAYIAYSGTRLAMPSPAAFADTYNNVFLSKHDALNEQGQVTAEGYFTNDLADLSVILDKKRKSFEGQDSISIEDAISICKAYCSYEVYNSTQALAQNLIAKINSDKYIEEDSVLVKMPDGGTISLAVVRDKKITTPQPVVLLYNIYAGRESSDCKRAVKKGFIGVEANTRGKRLSPDAIEPLEHDAADAYYIIDWISKQPWCNGKVGMYGGSYLGFSQWSAVKHLHPALKTIVPQVAVGAGIDYPNFNGIYCSYMLQWLHYVMDNKLIDYNGFYDTQKWHNTFNTWYKSGRAFNTLDTIEGRPNYIFQRWLQHPDYDAFWKNMTPQQEEFANINIPIFTTTGYWDDDQLGALYYYKQYHKYNKNPNYYLLIGPYNHGGAQAHPAKELGGYRIDSVANVPIVDIVFEWFNYILKDSVKPAILQDKVNFEVMGTNEWKHVSSIDKMSNSTLKLYLGNTLHDKEFALLKSKPAQNTFITQTVDLKAKTDTLYDSEEALIYPNMLDSIRINHPQKLIFTTAPLDEPLTVSGALTASLVASINKKDFDITVDLFEQTADGNYFALSRNLQRASYLNDRTKRQLLTPGKTTTLLLTNNFITSRYLPKGSRIIVLVGVNKSAAWELNYGSGKDVSKETVADAGAPLTVHWYNNSYIELPILK